MLILEMEGLFNPSFGPNFFAAYIVDIPDALRGMQYFS